MTQYRACLTFVTSGNALVEAHTEWVDHRDQLDELVRSLAPFENQKETFTEYEIEEKRDVTLEATEDY